MVAPAARVNDNCSPIDRPKTCGSAAHGLTVRGCAAQRFTIPGSRRPSDADPSQSRISMSHSCLDVRHSREKGSHECQKSRHSCENACHESLSARHSSENFSRSCQDLRHSWQDFSHEWERKSRCLSRGSSHSEILPLRVRMTREESLSVRMTAPHPAFGHPLPADAGRGALAMSVRVSFSAERERVPRSGG